MANTNLTNFLSNAGLLLLNYGAGKLNDKATGSNTVNFTPTRTAIYNIALQALNQEIQERINKSAATQAVQTTETDTATVVTQ